MARLDFAPATVLTTTEARTQLPSLAESFRTEGVEAGVVFFGPHRHPDGAIVPAALLEALAPYLEDLVVAERVRQRLADDTGERLSLRQLDERLGLDRADVESEAAALRAELRLS
ncbi:MAG: hypothetical protein ACRDPR_09845 [Nocardioidaceae bacterium]